MAKGDSICIQDVNGQGLRKTKVVSSHKYLHHKMKMGVRESSPINNKKRSGRHKPGHAVAQVSSRSRTRDINPKNWRERGKIFAKKGKGKVGHHQNETKEQRDQRKMKHFDSEAWKLGKRGRDSKDDIADRIKAKLKSLIGKE